MGKSVSLDVARDGISLLSGLMKEEKAYNDEKNVTKEGLKTFIADHELESDPVVKKALMDVYNYTCSRYETKSPTMRQINGALKEAMRNIANVDNKGNDNDKIDPSEFKTMAKTWKSIMTFSRDYKDCSVDDVIHMNTGHE
jgi:hypothetical protein